MTGNGTCSSGTEPPFLPFLPSLPLLQVKPSGARNEFRPRAASAARAVSHPPPWVPERISPGATGAMPSQDINVILATDCGSTTTKAILIEKVDGEYRLRTRGEAPTTVEAPIEDVTRGVLNAIAEVEELSGRKILEGEDIIRPATESQGVDIYVSTSSAGGGLQVMVVGLVRRMTAESAQRAALGAGAIVMDVLSLDDGRLPHQRIAQLRELRPDMILISGGVDGGEVRKVVEMTELVAAANPKARLGARYELPVIYAGNVDAREAVTHELEGRTALAITDNLRPTMDREHLGPARAMIQDLFLEHVMAQAPGYGKLIPWTDADIMPTPAAVGLLIETVARERGINVVGVDIGGATTDVFSVFGGVFNRTVSANLGMSYSVSNVLAEAGPENVLRWLSTEYDPEYLGQQVRNKMIRPTTIPQRLASLQAEQAIAREALRLAMEQHKLLATGLKGVQQSRDISDAFTAAQTGESLVNMMALDLLIGSGGVLSHAPRRCQSALMMIDAFAPEGVTQLAVDSIFMMPQLGVLSGVHAQAAEQVFQRDCLIPLGTCVAPAGSGKAGQEAVRVSFDGQDVSVAFGQMALLPLAEGAEVEARLQPARGFDVGAGRGRERAATLHGGVVGVIVDARGRPLRHAADAAERRARQAQWEAALGVYPVEG